MRIPYTPKEETAKIYKILILISAKTMCSSKGITAHPIKLKVKVRMGAAMNMAKLAPLGKTVSFNKSFKPSAKGCNKPEKPTTFGPLRRCMAAITLRSKSVK